MADKNINLLNVNVNEHTEKKNGLTYLSWAWAAAEMLKAYPDMTYTVERTADGKMYTGDAETGYMVNTSVTAGGITREMWLPVMDYRNKAILKPTTTDINKSIMRCLTKNFAMFGLGLYIYAGEDLPEETSSTQAEPEEKKTSNKSVDEKMQKDLGEKITPVQASALRNILKPNQLEWLLKHCKVEHIEDITKGQYAGVLKSLKDRPNGKQS